MAAHDMPHQADVSASAPKKPFARVATKLLGPILDGAHHFSAYAAHMLAIKATKGPGFALNETQLGLPFEQGGYAIGRRGFRGGIALMKKAGVLNRTQKRRHYATEKPLANSGSFVHIEEALLRNNSKLVAFILVVNLTPTPISQVDAAARLGITSPTIARRLAREAIGLGVVEHQVITKGAILLARKGHIFDLAKNEPAKNEPARNVPAENVPARNGVSHSNLEDDHSSREKPQDSESSHSLGQATRSSERGPPAKGVAKEEQKELGPEWIVLKDWRSSKLFRDRERLFSGNPRPVMAIDEWCRWLHWYGGSSLPAHLLTPASHRQALEIAHELQMAGSIGGAVVQPYMGMVGLAFAVSKAHASGKQIQSFGFIAETLIRRVVDGDDSWAYDLPCRIAEADFRRASDLANRCVCALEAVTYGIKVCRRQLLSTCAVERLSEMVRAHTESGVVEGINHATSNKLKQPEGHTISGWHWFNDAIAAAAKAKAASAAPTAPKPATNAPGAAFKGSLAVLDNNDAPTQSDLRILFEADTTKLLHPKLFRDPGGLRRLLKAQAALHGCSPAQVLDAIAEVLRHAAIHGKAAVADDVLRSGALICKHVRYWRRFESVIAAAMARSSPRTGTVG